MQCSLGLILSLSALAPVAARQYGDSGASRTAQSFLRKTTKLQPDVVAHSLSQVEEEWKDMAITFVECNQTLSELEDAHACKRAPKAFQKSCTTVVNSIFKASNGDRNNVQEYMSDICEQSSLKGWKGDHCRSLASNLVNAMSLDAFENRAHLTGSDLCKNFWSQFQSEEQTRLEKERIQQETIETKEAQARAEAEKKAAEERATAEKKRIEQEAMAAKEAEVSAKAAAAKVEKKAEKKKVITGSKSTPEKNNEVKKVSDHKEKAGAVVLKGKVENATAQKKSHKDDPCECDGKKDKDHKDDPCECDD